MDGRTAEVLDLHSVSTLRGYVGQQHVHRGVVAAQQEWADSADTAQSVAELFQSPEAQAFMSLNRSAFEACRRMQDAVDATVCWMAHGTEEAMNRFNRRKTA